MRNFVLLNDTVLLAEGVQFTDGTVVVRWVFGPHHSTVVWPSFAAFEEISGPGGEDRHRRIEWIKPHE